MNSQSSRRAMNVRLRVVGIWSIAIVRAVNLSVFAATAYLFISAASSAAEAPTVQVKVLDAKTVVVRGSGFSNEKLSLCAGSLRLLGVRRKYGRQDFGGSKVFLRALKPEVHPRPWDS